MDKYTYLFKSFNDRAYTKKAYLLSILSIVNKGQDDKFQDVPYALMRDWDNDQVYFIDPITRERVILDAVTPNKALFIKNEPLSIKASECRYVNDDINETTFGRFLFNVVVFYEAFQNRVPYLNQQIDARDIEKVIIDIMVDNPSQGEEIPPGKASVDECLKVTQQLDYLEGLNPVLVKASSLDVFSIDPEIIKLRDQLLKELEDNNKLNDPSAVSAVIDRLVAEDAKRVLNGPSRDLYIKKAFISNSRRKMFLLFDFVPDFHTGKYQLLRQSLAEGWDMSRFTDYTNTAIDGSYSRSVSVGAAGYEIKTALLLTSGISVTEEDCGSLRGEDVFLNEKNYYHWIGSYYLTKDGIGFIDEKSFDKFKGKTVPIRVPQFCKTPNNNLCKTCCGTKLGSIKDRVASEVTGILTSLFLLNMKKIHNSELSTRLFKIEDIIR